MRDLHDRFETWLAEATPGDPPRDLALHASGCGECLARTAAVDALRAIDPGLAPDPPLVAGEVPPPAGLRSIAPAEAGFAAVALLGVVVLIGSAALLGDRSPATGGGPGPTESPAEGVLGAAGGPDLTPEGLAESPTPTAEAGESPGSDDASPTPDGASAPVVPAPTPTTVSPGTPRPVTPPPPPPPTAGPTPEPTPEPTGAPTPTPQPTPEPTAAPTPEPTPEPTAAPTPTPEPTSEPTPEPTPSEEESAGSTASCANGVDDDVDLLVDELDLGCHLGTQESDL